MTVLHAEGYLNHTVQLHFPVRQVFLPQVITGHVVTEQATQPGTPQAPIADDDPSIHSVLCECDSVCEGCVL